MNRPKISVYIAQSLDGYIARQDGDLDWLNVESAGEDYGYTAFVDSVDAIIMGRNTFDQCVSFDPWPYTETKVIVLTSRELILSEELTKDVEVKNCSPHEVVSYAHDSGIKHIYCRRWFDHPVFSGCRAGRSTDYNNHTGPTWLWHSSVRTVKN